MRTTAILPIALCAILWPGPAPAGEQVRLAGVNIAGAEFGRNVPGRAGHDYFYPSPAALDYAQRKGMNVVRVPFRWERLQPALGAELDGDEAARLDAVVRAAASRGLRVILDVHNYAAYARAAIGTPEVPVSAFADLWRRLAARYRDRDQIVFGLMNEPKSLPTETWLAAANAAIAAIRQEGAGNLVLVPGNGWTGAHSWLKGNYGTANAQVMGGVNDPANNYAYELHQYLDRDYSGTHPQCVSEDVGVKALAPVTEWLRQRGRKGFLGEFGAGADPVCLQALGNMLAFMDANSDVWLGWTYWAAGPWPRDYFTSLEPVDGADRPQMTVLAKHLRPGAAPRPR